MQLRATAERDDERRGSRPASVAVALVLVLALVGGGITAGTAAAAGASSAASPSAERPAQLDAATAQAGGPPVGAAFQQEIDPDSVRLTVEVDANGTAHWQIEYWTELQTDNETEAFEQLQSDVAANPDEYTARFAQRMNQTVTSAENATGREMSAGEFGVSARTETIPQEYGVLTYTFTWGNFAVVDGERLRIGDAISGFFLNDQTRLLVAWPDGYDLVESRPDADERRDRAALWYGSQTDFVGDEPRVIVSSGDDSGTGGIADGGARGPVLWVGLALAVLALAGGGIALLGRDDEDGDDSTASVPSHDAADEPEDTASDEQPGAAGRGEEAAADAEPDGDAADDPPPDLLSNDERVRRALERNGGRMRQQELVEETGWTEAKTSQVVGEMREAGTIESFRLGRENVLKLPDEDDESSL
ncbi:hypothetical protein SAMN06269185_2556 [Natronoarchaeum philippinense]|uniref:IclR helix-turn-helix domain-containing protein n=1 Tax=Natronoarchaeum philippinense TaxID=558529 RepID=A0A285P1R0_NATPI|nr:hypothetical protein [Natronoarchaeum philippinense]SNZ15674.1 hypothetical protein SAMN06269185_2556 [Natronoarchaeum philippinense]